MYPTINLITNMDTRKATTTPIRSSSASFGAKWNPNLTSFARLAQSITGIASRNVNSTASFLENPIKSIAMIVIPDLEVPGNTAAIV